MWSSGFRAVGQLGLDDKAIERHTIAEAFDGLYYEHFICLPRCSLISLRAVSCPSETPAAISGLQSSVYYPR